MNITRGVMILLVLIATSCTGATPIPSPTPPAPTQTPWIITATPAAPKPIAVSTTTSPGAGAIAWSETSQYIGQTKTVCGNIVRTTFAQNTNGQPTYLDMGRAYPDSSRVSIVIWGSSRANFSTPPETLYRNKTICVTGVIKTYQGIPQIEVRTPADIEIK